MSYLYRPGHNALTNWFRRFDVFGFIWLHDVCFCAEWLHAVIIIYCVFLYGYHYVDICWQRHDQICYHNVNNFAEVAISVYRLCANMNTIFYDGAIIQLSSLYFTLNLLRIFFFILKKKNQSHFRLKLHIFTTPRKSTLLFLFKVIVIFVTKLINQICYFSIDI